MDARAAAKVRSSPERVPRALYPYNLATTLKYNVRLRVQKLIEGSVRRLWRASILRCVGGLLCSHVCYVRTPHFALSRQVGLSHTCCSDDGSLSTPAISRNTSYGSINLLRGFYPRLTVHTSLVRRQTDACAKSMDYLDGHAPIDHAIHEGVPFA